MNLLTEIHKKALQPLEKANSLPFAAYTDPEVLASEAERIFLKEWVLVCMAGELAKPGDYCVMTLASEPIVVMRGDDGDLTALSNICRHRGTTILDEGFGTVEKYLTCPYHAWAYEKTGALKAIPYNELITVDRAEHHLAQFGVETWNGLVFVNLDPNARPLKDRLKGIDQYLQLFQPGTFDQVSPGDVEVWDTNWKLAMENAMESYHLFKVHENTLETYSPTRDAYYIAGSSEWTLTGGATERKKTMIERVMGSSHNELFEHYVLVSLPPSVVGVLTYGSFGWLSAHPVDPDRTRIRSGATAASGGLDGSSTSREFTRAFFKEDKDMRERAQKGMRSKLSKGGKLVDMERVVVDFHQFLGTRLGGQPATQLYEDEAAAQWRTAQ